ncbi:MAG: SufS family cysteine desulfurase [Bowdeniella nasicola]|nr:SufS family cysteine desulfurase [Bowdeniella nasicola]
MPLAPVVDRSDFPALHRTYGQSELVYLDSAATSLKPRAVIEAEADFYARLDGAVHRGAHQVAVEATETYEGARERFAAFTGAEPSEITWTKNATEALNTVAYALLNATLDARGSARERSRIDPRFVIDEGDVIAVTQAEHHANFVPFQQLARRTGAEFVVIDVHDDGRIDLESARALPDRTKVVAFTHASNVTGAISPVAELVEVARERGALTVLDACQSAAHLPLDLHSLGVDCAAMSTHKMLGPTGVGVLYLRGELGSRLPPMLTGGSMVAVVRAEETIFMPAPQKWEAGTQMTAQIAGVGAMVDYLEGVGMDRIARHDLALGDYLVRAISSIEGVRIMGPTTGERLGLVSFQVGDVHPHDVGQYLDAAGIAVRVGHHCAQPIHRRLGVQSSTRASVGPYTHPDEIDAFAARLAGVLDFFQGNP